MYGEGVAFYSGFGCRGGVSCVQNNFLFLISSLSKFIIFIVIFSHHVVQITFFFLISICFDIAFFPNSDESNFDESKSLRFEIRNKKQFQNILKLGIKSNLDHVMRENDYENNEF